MGLAVDAKAGARINWSEGESLVLLLSWSCSGELSLCGVSSRFDENVLGGS